MEGTPVNQHLPVWPTGGVDMDAVSLHVSHGAAVGKALYSLYFREAWLRLRLSGGAPSAHRRLNPAPVLMEGLGQGHYLISQGHNSFSGTWGLRRERVRCSLWTSPLGRLQEPPSGGPQEGLGLRLN